MVGGLRQGFEQGFGQHAAGGAHARRPPAVLLCLEVVAVEVHHQPGQVLQCLAQLAGVGGHIGHFFHFDHGAHAQRAAGQLVNPAQPAQIERTGELGQGRGRQMVGFVEHQQTVVQVGQQASAQ
ncbi:hypothetical protein D3C78_1123830 [compost metagenome]